VAEDCAAKPQAALNRDYLPTMTMKSHAYQPVLHRFALATACLTLLPIGVGALVTTMNWGMAFLDYPTSDGHNMFLYPWLKAATDKFAEHGHRLAGFAIGVVSAALTLVAWKWETRKWVKVVATLIPFCVLLQGLLGGMRVLANDPRMAMVHGSFAALVFTLMSALVLLTSRSWIEAGENDGGYDVSRLKPLAVAVSIMLFGQYLLGGLLRHLGTALHEHIGLAVLALLVVIANTVVVHRGGNSWLRQTAWMLLAVVLVQMLLGTAAFVTKFGFAPTGYVAVQHSVGQVVVRTIHTIIGMLVLMTSIVHLLRVYRVVGLRWQRSPVRLESGRLDHAFPIEGGVR